MGAFGLFALFAALFLIVMCTLYREGVLSLKKTSAWSCALWPGKRRDRASMNTCTGCIRHVGRFRESRTYEFEFDCQLTRGDAAVSLLDRNKQVLRRLDRHSPAASAVLDRKERYYLLWEFQSATGKCELRW